MGTNYFLRKTPCQACGHYDETHIGKASNGCKFCFSPILGTTKTNILEATMQPETKIFNEYNEPISFTKFWMMVEDKQSESNQSKSIPSHFTIDKDGYEFINTKPRTEILVFKYMFQSTDNVNEITTKKEKITSITEKIFSDKLSLTWDYKELTIQFDGNQIDATGDKVMIEISEDPSIDSKLFMVKTDNIYIWINHWNDTFQFMSVLPSQNPIANPLPTPPKPDWYDEALKAKKED